MTEENPIACSLDPGDLRHRLSEIAAIGAESLIARDTEGDRYLLRFSRNEATRRRLAAIVAAEARCCSFLELSPEDREDALVLSIVAPEGAEAVASQLASAF
jgi:hypothetical protein